MRKLVSLLLAVMLVLSLAVTANAEEGKNVLSFSVGLNPSLDPHMNAGMDGYYVQYQLFEGLYRYTATGLEMAGCTSVDQSEDGLTWTFHLREDAKWSDGQSVVAGDYLYSFQRMVDPENPTTYAVDYGQFLLNGAEIARGEKDMSELGVTAIDDFTLEVKLAAVCPYFDAICVYSTFYPMRADVTKYDGGSDWAYDPASLISNGAMMMTECDPEQKIILMKNPYYWDAANVTTDEIDVFCVADSNTNLALFKNGDLDIIYNYPSEETEALMNDGYFHAATALGSGFLLCNCNEGRFTADPAVRKALSLCIDREFLADVLLGGIKEPAQTYIGSGFPGASSEGDYRSESETMLTYDVDQAKALLADAGYTDADLSNVVMEIPYTNAISDYQILFEYLQSTWEENLGITVVLSPMDGNSWGECRASADFDVTIQNWYADYYDVSNMLSIWVTGHGINQGKYTSEKFDSLYAASLTEADNVTRIDMLHQAETTLVVDDMGIIPLYHNRKVFLYDDGKLDNVNFNADAFLDFTKIIKK